MVPDTAVNKRTKGSALPFLCVTKSPQENVKTVFTEIENVRCFYSYSTFDANPGRIDRKQSDVGIYKRIRR